MSSIRFTTRSTRTLAAALVIAGLTLAPRPASPQSFAAMTHKPTEDEVSRYLDEVVFGTEYGAKTPILTTWGPSLTWTLIDGDVVLRTKIRAYMGFLDTYASATDFTEVATPGEAQLRVYLGKLSSFPDRADIDQTFNGYVVGWSNGARLLKADVWLNPRAMAGPDADRVLREELFQAMGFFGDSAVPGTSITSSVDQGVQKLQSLDMLALVFAYSLNRPELVTKADFVGKINRIVADAKAKGK